MKFRYWKIVKIVSFIGDLVEGYVYLIKEIYYLYEVLFKSENYVLDYIFRLC